MPIVFIMKHDLYVRKTVIHTHTLTVGTMIETSNSTSDKRKTLENVLTILLLIKVKGQ